MSSSTQNDLQINSEGIVKRIARYIAKNGFKYEKRMMNNIKNPRLNFLRSPEDPLHGYYKQKLSEYLSQIQENGAIVDDFDDDVATNTSAQVIEPPPGIIRNDIEWMASYISKGGLVVERMMMHLNAEDARYSFMCRSDPFHAFYRQKLTDSRNQQDGANHDYDAAAKKATEYRSWNQQVGAQRIVLPHLLEFRLPKGMNVKEFRTMKLTAQFGAWYGNDFWLVFKNRAGFENEELPPPGTGSGMSPPEPEPKRQKFDEPGLVPEDQFLAQHPGWCTIRVSVVGVDGRELDIIEKTVQSLSENVASLKEKIAEEIRIPPEKQVLFRKAGLFEDNNRSLAHYNVGVGEILTLSLCMCGRERDLDKPYCCREMLTKAIGEIMLSYNSRFN